MQRRALVAAGLAVLTGLTGGLPAWVAPTAAASCSSWTSETDPPPTIRVFRHVTGAVETADFRTYTKNVLSREWIGSWTAASLGSGALAVKHYAWYQVLHWRGGLNIDGTCFDLRDDTYDQVYDPSQPTWNTAAAAVDETWATRVLKNGSIFPTYYNAGTVHEGCAANANGWKLWQWGSQGCGLAGKTTAEIMLLYYYPAVTVTDPAGATPTPAPSTTPTPTPTPTPSPTPTPTPSPTAGPPAPPASPTPTPAATTPPTPLPTPVPTPKPTPVPTPKLTPVPTPTPLPSPPVQQLLGGGQVGVDGAAAPPQPPSADPTAVIVEAGAQDPTAVGAFRGVLEPWQLRPVARSRTLAWLERGWEGAYVWPDHPATEIAGFVTERDTADPSLATFSALFGPAAQRLLTALARGFAADGGLALRFGPPGS